MFIQNLNMNTNSHAPKGKCIVSSQINENNCTVPTFSYMKRQYVRKRKCKQTRTLLLGALPACASHLHLRNFAHTRATPYCIAAMRLIYMCYVNKKSYCIYCLRVSSWCFESLSGCGGSDCTVFDVFQKSFFFIFQSKT